MSHDVFELVRNMDLNDVTMQLILQCAPLISGLKFSNLLTIQRENAEESREILEHAGIQVYVLLEMEEKVAILAYKEEQLQSYLTETDVMEFLRKLHYDRTELELVLPELKSRYSEYMNDRKTFPHEMGILLGYPLEDVEGFMCNDGKNFLYTGYWKVYKNMPEKKKLFSRFESEQDKMIRLASRGFNIKDIINYYEEPYRCMAV